MLRVILVATCSLFLVSPGFRANIQDQVPELTLAQKEKLPTVLSTSIAIRRVARILDAPGIRIEAGQLFSRNGMKKLRQQLSAFPEMRLSKVQSEPLRGVIMADRLTLAEKLEIEADTVIIANHIVFSGRAPLFKGSYDFHLFPLESFKSEYGRGTVITIDTSATIHGVAGVNGVNGTHGKFGTSGSTGVRGSCSTIKNGGKGEPGLDGTPGVNGTSGTNGTSGMDGGHQTLPISNVDVGEFHIIASGGHGGNAGHGGHGGAGGPGGNGGHGGNGAGCKCDAGGNGDGGRGGAAGAGGAGGSGGDGGDGGNGGNAGNVVISRPFVYETGTISFKTSGGLPGHGGHAGYAGYAGAAGAPGAGGIGPERAGCERGRDGDRGLMASAGAAGIAGKRGTPGRRGDSTLSWNSWEVTGRGVGGSSGFEPGATSEKCTEWFWVTFRCESSQCYEIGRTYIGCF